MTAVTRAAKRWFHGMADQRWRRVLSFAYEAPLGCEELAGGMQLLYNKACEWQGDDDVYALVEMWIQHSTLLRMIPSRKP